MVRAEIAPDEAEDAGGLDVRQGRQRSMAPFLPEQIKGFYGSSVLWVLLVSPPFAPVRSGAQCAPWERVVNAGYGSLCSFYLPDVSLRETIQISFPENPQCR